MKLILIAQVNPARIAALSVAGDVLSIDGKAFDFAPLLEGDQLAHDACEDPRITGATRAAGQVEVTLAFPVGERLPAWATAPGRTAVLTVAAGAVPLPAYEEALDAED